jgi:hypothetical protein
MPSTKPLPLLLLLLMAMPFELLRAGADAENAEAASAAETGGKGGVAAWRPCAAACCCCCCCCCPPDALLLLLLRLPLSLPLPLAPSVLPTSSIFLPSTADTLTKAGVARSTSLPLARW